MWTRDYVIIIFEFHVNSLYLRQSQCGPKANRNVFQGQIHKIVAGLVTLLLQFSSLQHDKMYIMVKSSLQYVKITVYG